MRQHADDALPGRLFFFAQRLAEVGDDDQHMRTAVAVELRAADLVAAALLAAEAAVDEAARLAGEVLVEPELSRRLPDQLVARLADHLLGGLVDEEQLVGRIEREDGDGDLLHHVREQHRRLDGFGPLALQREAEVVDLAHHHRHRAAAPGAQAADRVVALTQRAEQVGDQVQRSHRELPRRRSRSDPDQDDDARQRPPHLDGQVLPNQEIPCHRDRRKRAGEHEQKDRQLEVARARSAAALGQAVRHVHVLGLRTWVLGKTS